MHVCIGARGPSRHRTFQQRVVLKRFARSVQRNFSKRQGKYMGIPYHLNDILFLHLIDGGHDKVVR